MKQETARPGEIPEDRGARKRAKIVVLDGATLNPGDNPWDEIEALGDLTVYERTPRGLIVERSAGAAVLLTNKTPLGADILAELPELRFISVLATGHNVVDGAAARRRGIPVSNVPEYGSDSVAQHVIALLLELTNAVGSHDAAVKSGRWAACEDFCFWQQAPVDLHGKTIGLLGLGRIGSRVAVVAHALGMKVIAYTPSRSAAAPCRDFAWCGLDELFARADVLSLHCPQTAENTGLVDAPRLASMKPGAFLINTARGALIDEAALAAALSSGTIAGAAVDVVSAEPISPANPLPGAPNCIVTPHMAWAGLPSRRRLMAATAENLRAFLRGKPINVVN